MGYLGRIQGKWDKIKEIFSGKLRGQIIDKNKCLGKDLSLIHI